MKQALDNLKKWAETNGMMLLSENDNWFFGKRRTVQFIKPDGEIETYHIRISGYVSKYTPMKSKVLRG